jgi:hypothetical protein
MSNENYQFVNDHVMSEEELSILITEKFQRLQEQLHMEHKLREKVDNKYQSMIRSY